MRAFISSLLLPLLAAQALAQATVTEYITVPPTTAASLSPTASAIQKQASNDHSTTIAPSTTQGSAAPFSSMLQATSTISWQPGASSMNAAAGDGGYDPGSGSGGAVDSNAGASGSSSSSFSISKGGVIAIAVVVSVVAAFGIASTVLFFVAKRRQWNVRASIARASRRLTGRSRNPAPSRTPGAGHRGTTINAGRLAGTSRGDFKPLGSKNGHKRGLVVEEKDLEMGALPKRVPGYGQPKENKWVHRLWGNDWK